MFCFSMFITSIMNYSYNGSSLDVLGCGGLDVDSEKIVIKQKEYKHTGKHIKHDMLQLCEVTHQTRLPLAGETDGKIMAATCFQNNNLGKFTGCDTKLLLMPLSCLHKLTAQTIIKN